jgi:glutamyl-tRNA synthetase
MKVKTRFAPSPTGYLHIGGARTALFAWLFARNHHGIFSLRIEDTDLERSTEMSVTGILDALKWLGLSWDQDIVYQSRRLSRYQEILDHMVSKNLAYHCNCDQHRLKTLRDEQISQKLKPKYDNYCRDKSVQKSETTVIRFRNPLNGNVVFDDLVFGQISVGNQELDDLVLQRSDGMPTYNFAVVVDDYDMGITHVIRGDDHINNTPKQINILKALNFNIPKFAHLPMILNEDGKRMSKRFDAVNVMHYKREGFLPEALLNYLVRLGWSYGDQEIFSVDQMIKHFSLSKVNTSPAIFSKDKLIWLNKYYIQDIKHINYHNELSNIYKSYGIQEVPNSTLLRVIEVFAKRSSTLQELAKSSLFLFKNDLQYNHQAIEQFFVGDIENSIEKLVELLQDLSNWEVEEISTLVKRVVREDALKFPQLAQPLRIALTGDINSPSIDQVIFLLGKEKAISRINKMIA